MIIILFLVFVLACSVTFINIVWYVNFYRQMRILDFSSQKAAGEIASIWTFIRALDESVVVNDERARKHFEMALEYSLPKDLIDLKMNELVKTLREDERLCNLLCGRIEELERIVNSESLNSYKNSKAPKKLKSVDMFTKAEGETVSHE
jgi:hypothetical protein